MNEVQKKNDIYSYHTFLFPFIWEDEKGKKYNEKTMKEFFSNNRYWKRKQFDKGAFGLSFDHERAQEYAEYCYFHPAARSAILGDANEIVMNYQIDPKILQNGATYTIRKQPYDKEEKTYELTVLDIFLKVFNTGVAVLGLECINDKYTRFDEIKQINDYGRRILLPFIPMKEGSGDNYWQQSICADFLRLELNLSGDKKFVSQESFKDMIIKLNGDNAPDLKESKEQEVVSDDHICCIITDLLRLGVNNKEWENSAFTQSESKVKKKIRIYPALDDRMYVMCLLCDNIIVEQVKSRLIFKNEKRLYEFAFVDAESCTCASDKMRKKFLEEHIYERWQEAGTLYTVTAQAFNCICNFKPVEETFRHQYREMCILTLVQHASLINFQNIAMRLSYGLEKDGKALKTKKIAELMDFQERYIAFQNQINFSEVSSEEQAIELYGLMRKSAGIESLNQAIKDQLNALYDATNTNQEFSFNKGAFILALIALGIDVPTILFRATGEVFWKSPMSCLHFAIIVVTAVAVVVVWCKFSRKRWKKIRRGR